MGDVILAIDCATQTGLGVGPVGGIPKCSSHRIGSVGCSIGAFGHAYDEWLSALIAVHRPAVLAFEAPILTAGKTPLDMARKLMGLAFLTETIAHRMGVRHVVEENSSVVTKFFTGRGQYENRAKKKQAVIDQCRRLGWAVEDDNAADAAALFRFAEYRLYPKARIDVPGPLAGAA